MISQDKLSYVNVNDIVNVNDNNNNVNDNVDNDNGIKIVNDKIRIHILFK